MPLKIIFNHYEHKTSALEIGETIACQPPPTKVGGM